MPLMPQNIESVASAIGDQLEQSVIEQAMRDATGKELYKQFAGPRVPLNLAIQNALVELNEDGRERWFLTYVLIDAVAFDALRRVIFNAYPVLTLPNLDVQVDQVLGQLKKVVEAVVKPDIKLRLAPWGGAFAAIPRNIDTFLAYKSLHASLHGLQLKLTVRPPLGPDAAREKRIDELKGWCKQVTEVSVNARKFGSQLAQDPDVPGSELDWISRLELLVRQWQLALNASDVDSGSTFLKAVQLLVPLQLSVLNGRIFESARKLSISDLVFTLPLDIRGPFIDYAYAVQDLKPTVLARVFEHKIWQDVDDGISELEQLFDDRGGAAKFKSQWVTLGILVYWLTTLYPNAKWPATAKKYADNINEQLGRKNFELAGSDMAVDSANPKIKPMFEDLRRLMRFQFLEIDTNFKNDCSSLLKFVEPLGIFMKGINDG
jgi:hypothetical protein